MTAHADDITDYAESEMIAARLRAVASLTGMDEALIDLMQCEIWGFIESTNIDVNIFENMATGNENTMRSK